MRGRWLRQDGGCHSCGIQGGTGGQAGRILSSDHHFGTAALQYLYPENDGLPRAYRAALPFPYAEAAEGEFAEYRKGLFRNFDWDASDSLKGCQVQEFGADYRG